MAVKLHRCSLMWFKVGVHPCWSVEKALQDMGIAYEAVSGPLGRGKRGVMVEHTGQKLYPAIEFEDGSWYREESKDMAATIRAGKLMEHAKGAAPAASG